jgi:hypothetical protein
VSDDTILARLKTQNVGQFVAEIGAASKSVLGFGVAEEEAAAKAKLTWIETKALGVAMYSLRRYAFYGITALGASAVAAVKMGLSFDEAKQQATGAFTATLGGAAAARREVQLLTADTEQTGIQLGALASSAETMQSFGFTLRDVNTDILAMANYAERAHKGVAGFNSLVEVFDRIHQKGQLTALDLRTLTAEGIPALAILRKQLNLTPAQVALLQKNKLVIPAQYALPALAQGLVQRSNVLGTNVGQQLGRTHAFLAQIFGTGESGLFGFVTKGLEGLNARLKRGAAGQQTGGLQGLLLGMDPSGRLLRAEQTLANVTRAVADAFVFAWKVALPLRILVAALAGGTAFLAGRTGLLTIGLKTLAFWYIATRTRMLLFAGAEKVVAATTFLLDSATTIYIASLYAYDLAIALFTLDTEAAAAALTALNLVFLANPITWIIIGVAALGVGLYLLVTRVKAVRTAFVWVFDEVREGFRDLIHWISKAWNLLSFHVGGFSVFGHHIGGFTLHVTPIGIIPGLASGGDVSRGGTALIGERGPELLNLPAGARVTPLTRSSGSGDLFAAIGSLIEALSQGLVGDVTMDAAKVGEAIFRAKQLREAIA